LKLALARVDVYRVGSESAPWIPRAVSIALEAAPTIARRENILKILVDWKF
jgi:hypothetical protein